MLLKLEKIPFDDARQSKSAINFIRLILMVEKKKSHLLANAREKKIELNHNGNKSNTKIKVNFHAILPFSTYSNRQLGIGGLSEPK